MTTLQAPGATPLRLEDLTPAQRARLVELARTRREASAVPAASAEPLHVAFERWAARRPEAVALTCGARELRYGELNTQAHALAQRLLAAGLPRGGLVAITLDRDLPLIVAILAVMKAGGAYLPIDPSVPRDRQRLIRDDAGARFALSQSDCRSLFEGTDCTVWMLDDPVNAGAPATAIAQPEVRGEDLAYVIYTSGSTGQPKGVMVEHRHVARLFTSAQAHFRFSERDVWSLLHSYAFDFSVWEIWGALCHGGRLVVAPADVARSPGDVADLLLAQRVTVLNQTPTAFSNLMQQLLARDDCGALRCVIFGGEALEPRRLARWFERFGDEAPELVNMYGITETTVHVTHKRLRTADAAHGLSDIGSPLADLTLHVLNERGRPVPEGAIGEIHVGGAGVARGYLNRPELTAERFLDDPFAPGGRLYRTGDLARRLPGGRLEYIGRNDGQVKLRGFRIELGEIERQLVAHASVHDAVAVLRGEGDERFLAAFVVRAPEPPGGAAEAWRAALRAHLEATLPPYMVPLHLRALAVLPMTDNGKIDRAALPETTAADAWRQAYAAPRNEAERRLCAVVARLLGVVQVGVDDNFFALGGDSLKVVKLVAEARVQGLVLEVADVFAAPGVAALAARAQQVSDEGSPTTAPSAAGSVASKVPGPFDLLSAADRDRLPVGIEAAYPMTRLQQGMVFHNLASADNTPFHNVLHQRYRGTLDLPRMHESLAAVVAAHEILRTSLHLEGYSQPLQLVHGEVPTPMHVTDLRTLPADAQEAHVATALARLRAQRLDLSAPPLFQAHVYRIADDVFDLIWLEHHAILDGWSLASLMAQLTSDHSARIGDPTGRWVQAPTTRWRELVAAEQGALADAEQVSFWNTYLAGAPFVALQGAEDPDPAGSLASSPRIAPCEIPPAIFARCRDRAAQIGVPLKSLFLAAHARVIAKFGNELDLTLGLTTHGRPGGPDSETLLGLYVSMHPLRVSCERASWRTLIRRCHEAEAEIWPRRFFPLAEIKRRAGGRELFETSFTFNHFSVVERGADLGIAAARMKDAFEANDTPLGVVFAVADLQAARCQVNVSFDPARFDAAFAARIQRALLAAVENIAHGLDDVADLPVDGGEDGAAIAAGADFTVRDSDHLLAEFEAQVRRHGQAPALSQKGRTLDYAELDARSVRFATALQGAGVGAGDLVGFDASPSIDLVAALLAVFRLGAVFVPLDPEQSVARLRGIVEESGMVHIVADVDRWHGRLPASVRVHALGALDALAHAIEPEVWPSVALDANRLAYVIYTSGSSGRPKGVTISHGNAVSFLRAVRERYALQPQERLLQVSNIGFDIFIEELLVTVFSGGTLVLRDTPRLPDAPELWELLARERIQLVHVATAYWHLLCGQLPDDAMRTRLGALRLFVVGGEAMQRAHADRWLACFGPRVALLNSYGPTEVTVAATTFDVRQLRRTPRGHAGVPIGRPLANAQCLVLGQDLLPVPRGVIGELHVGGAGVSPGYLRQPDETRQKFLMPDAAFPGSPRLYATGDLVRVASDGELTFFGRADGQVKVRGFRVELDEVRHAVCRDPSVRDAVVVPVNGEQGQRLAVYVVFMAEAGAAALPELAARTAALLPGYMQPSAWMALDALPLTPNRKVDVAALPAPTFEPTGDGLAAPTTETERAIAALWAAALQREVAGLSIDADFFAIGGHSLLLTRLLLRIAQACEVELSMAELMRTRTVRGMSALVDAARSVARSAEASPAGDGEELEW